VYKKGLNLSAHTAALFSKPLKNSKMHLPDDEFASLQTISFGKATLKK
jgi:hypothetical protein